MKQPSCAHKMLRPAVSQCRKIEKINPTNGLRWTSYSVLYYFSICFDQKELMNAKNMAMLTFDDGKVKRLNEPCTSPHNEDVESQCSATHVAFSNSAVFPLGISNIEFLFFIEFSGNIFSFMHDGWRTQMGCCFITIWAVNSVKTELK